MPVGGKLDDTALQHGIVAGKAGSRGFESRLEIGQRWSVFLDHLAEVVYKNLVAAAVSVEVFEVENWCPKQRGKNKTIDKEKNIKIQIEVTGYGFNGVVAPDEIRNLYINKSVAHTKKRGAAQVIRYNL